MERVEKSPEYEILEAEIATWCEHFLPREHCIYCGTFKDVPMQIYRCALCESGTWHRLDRERPECLKCGSASTEPFDPPIVK